MADLPTYISATFVAIVLAIIGFIYFALETATQQGRSAIRVVVFLMAWILVVSILTITGYFTNLSGFPRLFIYIAIPIVATILAFAIRRSRRVIAKIPITTLHYIHIVRVPVEMVLWWLAAASVIPTDMTFEGSNFDIISGISAPFAAVFMVGKEQKSRIGAILWNLIALFLLFYIVRMAISFTPYFFTPEVGQVANIGIFFFPYVLLPTFIVPVIAFCHFAALFQLLFNKSYSQY